MELAKYKACICEGSAENAIMDILLDNDLLIFTREEMLEEAVIRCRDGKSFEEKYLRKGFLGKISVIRILDSRRENFKLSKAYEHKVDVINVITAPEIEMLIIFNEDKYKEFKKSGKKPSDFCKEDLKITSVKSYSFVKDYFSDPDILLAAIKKYHEISKIRKGEYTCKGIKKSRQQEVCELYFYYAEREVEYLKTKDERLREVIEKIGHVDREVDTDLFSSVVHHIIGQQISTKAQATIWARMKAQFGEVNAESISAADIDTLQSLGMTFRKAEYIKDFAEKVKTREFALQEISQLPDNEAIKALASLKGIGVWTAEMILLFCLQRPNIFSFDDLAIQRGLRMVYHHRKIDRKLFEKYRRRFSPYCSVASLYLWAVAGGAIPGMKDYAPKKNRRK